MIDVIFLDIGNILLDEDRLTYLVFRRHVEAILHVHPACSFTDLLAEREARAAAGSAWPVWEVASAYLDEAKCAEVWDACVREVHAKFAELSPLVLGADELIENLARRFRLGLVANQGADARDRLGALGLLDRFEIVALSETEGLYKPDTALFQRAIARSGVPASRCMMVGDRLDNDLAPAAALGMITAWVRWPRREAKGWNPLDPDEHAYLQSLARSAARTAEVIAHIRPELVVDEIKALPAALASMAG